MSLPPLRAGSLICSQICAERAALPGHRSRRQVPFRMAGHARGIEVGGADGRCRSACRARRGRRRRAPPAAGAAASRRSAAAARSPDGSSRSADAAAPCRPPRTARRRALRDRRCRRSRRRGRSVAAAAAAAGVPVARARRWRQRRRATPQRGRDERCALRITPSLRTIGSRRGRPRPSRAIALATAGAIGGTPGSPTPVGFSVERHDRHLDLRHLVDAQRAVGVEVAPAPAGPRRARPRRRARGRGRSRCRLPSARG